MKRILQFCLALLISVPAMAQQVTTYAGTAQTSGYTSGLNKASSKFNQPYGLAYDTNGNIWISESGGHVIKMIDATGKVYARAGAYGQAGFYNASGIVSKFNSPCGIAVGPNNYIYVADKDNHVIRKISPFTGLSNAQSVTVFAGRYTASGQNYTSYPGYADGSATSARFQNPVDVAVDDTGNVYVADQGNHIIRKITPAGVVTTLAGQPNSPGSTDGNAKSTAQFSSPTGVYYVNGVIYVADLGNSKIRKIDLASQTVSTVVSGLWTPSDVVKIGSDYFITDQHRIRLWDGSNLTTYAGAYYLNMSGYQDGYDTAARFYNVKSIGYYGANNILVADQDNHVIRKVSVCQSFTPQLTLSGNDTFCNGDSLVITAPSGYARYIWSTGDTTQSITVTTTKSVYVVLKDADSCTGTSATINVKVNSTPSSAFSLDGHACTSDDDTITYTGSAGGTATYTWDFDNGIVVGGGGQGPMIVQWDTAGQKTITLTVSKNGCASTTTHSTMVDTTPTPFFSVRSPICEKETDTIFYTGNASSTAKYTWDFDGGTITGGTGQGPIYLNWKVSGAKDLSLVVKENQCESLTYNVPVDVNPLPSATFYLDSAVCSGLSASANYKGSSTNTTFVWDFDSATVVSGSGAGPYQLKWSQTGWKTVSLVVTRNNCTSPLFSRQIRIRKVPTSTFTTTSPGCTDFPDTISYTGNGSSNATFQWDFDGGNIVTGSGAGPYLVSWSSDGTKNITLQVDEDLCSSDLHTEQMVVTKGPTPYFDIKSKLCQGEDDTLTYTGSGSSTATYTWNFTGANIISGSGQGPYILNWGTGGKKNVSLIVAEGGCSSTENTVSVNVIFMPLSYFETDTALCVNKDDSVKFTGYASTQAVFSWDFSGGFIKSGSGEGPYVIRWGGSGAKVVSLIIEDQGCTSVNTEKTVNVYNNPPKPNVTNQGDYLYSSSKYNNQWYDSSGMVWGADGQEFYPSFKGWYYVRVTNSHGCSVRSDWIVYIPVGIKEQNAGDIRVYPNPFSDQLVIKRPVENKGFIPLYFLYSSEGKLIGSGKLTEAATTLDLKQLDAGIYQLKVLSSRGTSHVQLIKY